MGKNDEKFKHLDFVQLTITRMGANSFFLKGWTVTISAALFAFADKDVNPAFAVVALVAAFSLWGMDAYYVRQERLFRKLYDDIRKDNKVEPLSMHTSKYEDNVESWFKTLFTGTVIGLHGVVTFAIICSLAFLYSDKIAAWHAGFSSASTSNVTSGGQESSGTVGSRMPTESQPAIGTPQSGKRQSEKATMPSKDSSTGASKELP